MKTLIAFVALCSPAMACNQFVSSFGSTIIQQSPVVIEQQPLIIEQAPLIIEQAPLIIEQAPQIIQRLPQVIQQRSSFSDGSSFSSFGGNGFIRDRIPFNDVLQFNRSQRQFRRAERNLRRSNFGLW